MIKCDDVAFAALLDADDEQFDSTVDGTEVEQHVASCSSCQRRLSQLAAEDRQWEEIPKWLSHDERLQEIRNEPGGNRERWNRPIAWSESMAKSLLAPPSHPELLGRIGRYDVERLIGSGGMGVVFKAHDTELNRPVAIKLLAPYLAENGSARKRFAREARSAAGVVDDHVVPIYNVESENDPPFLVMQYVAGGSLQETLDRSGPLDVCEILRIGMQTAKGLAAAHSQGLIHRDVKPSNILLDEGVERALLTDFGLARAENDACLTRSGFHPGTPHYMSPEQVRGEAIDSRSDLFSLGCALYALCTGHPPFRAETSYAVLRHITDDAARPIRELNPDIPEWLERIVMKLLSKSREDRFDSAEQVAKLLENCLAHVQDPKLNSLPSDVSSLTQITSSLFYSRPAGAFAMLALLSSIAFTLLMMQPPATPPGELTAVAGEQDTEATAGVPVDGVELLEGALTQTETLAKMTGEFDYVLRVAQSPPSEQQIQSAAEGTRAAMAKVIKNLKEKLRQTPDAHALQTTLKNYEAALLSNEATIRKGMLENSMREFTYHYLVGRDASYVELQRVATPEAPSQDTLKLLVSRSKQGPKNLSIQYDKSTHMAIVNSDGVTSGSQEPMHLGRIHETLAAALKVASPLKAGWFDVRKIETEGDRATYEITSNGKIKGLADFRLRVVPSLGYVTPLVQELGENGNVVRQWKSGPYFRGKNSDLWYPETVTFQENQLSKQIHVYTFDREKVKFADDIDAARMTLPLSKGELLIDARNADASINYTMEEDVQITLKDIEDIERTLEVERKKDDGIRKPARTAPY